MSTWGGKGWSVGHTGRMRQGSGAGWGPGELLPGTSRAAGRNPSSEGAEAGPRVLPGAGDRLGWGQGALGMREGWVGFRAAHLVDLPVVGGLVVVVHLIHILHVLVVLGVLFAVLIILIVLLLLLVVVLRVSRCSGCCGAASHHTPQPPTHHSGVSNSPAPTAITPNPPQTPAAPSLG